MKYVRIRWRHHDLTEPAEFLYEVQADGWAVRGIEVFCGGAMTKIEHGLREGPIPPINELDGSEFEGEEISREAFEAIWLVLMGLGAAPP